MPETQNIYQLMTAARAALTELELKKSGKNKHTNASYYELGDFMPAINKLNSKHGITTHFNIYPKRGDRQEVAVLKVMRSADPKDCMVWATPTAEVSLQGGQPIQNLGGKHTYMRRYMYMEAYEISEGDAVDAQEKEDTSVLDPISQGKIDQAKTHEELVAVCAELKKELGAEYQKPLVAYYTKRKNEINEQFKKEPNATA